MAGGAQAHLARWGYVCGETKVGCVNMCGVTSAYATHTLHVATAKQLCVAPMLWLRIGLLANAQLELYQGFAPPSLYFHFTERNGGDNHGKTPVTC